MPTNDPDELRRQIDQARRLAAIAGPILAANLLIRVKELEEQLAEIEARKD